MFPPFGLSSPAVVPRTLGCLRLNGRSLPLPRALFLDLQEGLLPVNRAAQYYVTLQESIIAVCTLNDLVPLLNQVPFFQRFALVGPMIVEAISQFEALRALRKSGERSSARSKSNFVAVLSEDQSFTLDQLGAYFGEAEDGDASIRLLRNNVFAHRSPILSPSKKGYENFAEALCDVTDGSFFRALTALEDLSNQVADVLISQAIWGQCKDGILSTLIVPKGSAPTRADLEFALVEMSPFVRPVKAANLLESVREAVVGPRVLL